MEKGLESFGLREIVVIIFPALYFFSLLIPIHNQTEVLNLDNKVANNASFIVLSLLLGIILYWVDIPKMLPFFKNNLPTKKLEKEFPNIDKKKIANCYFKFYDSLPKEQLRKTEFYTSIYHFCINIASLSLIIIILYLFIPPFSYGVLALCALVASLLSAIGLVYGKRKIKYMFDRQLAAFQESADYNELK